MIPMTLLQTSLARSCLVEASVTVREAVRTAGEEQEGVELELELTFAIKASLRVAP